MREAKLCGLHHLKIPVAMSLSVFTRVDAEHRRLIDAAANRDARSAAQLVRAHNLNTVKILRQHLEHQVAARQPRRAMRAVAARDHHGPVE